jgi:hypothetical protein
VVVVRPLLPFHVGHMFANQTLKFSLSVMKLNVTAIVVGWLQRRKGYGLDNY